MGKENLCWAPQNVKLQHKRVPTLETIVKKLEDLEAEGGKYDDFVKLLKALGEEAAGRK